MKEDPLPRVVTAAIVNWHPWGYDPSKVLTWRDKGSVRLLAGGTLTPDFGVTVGAGSLAAMVCGELTPHDFGAR